MAERWELLLGSAVDAGVGRWLLAGTIHDGRGLAAGGPMRVLDSYAAVAVLRGPVAYADAEGRRHEAGTGDVLLIRPGLPHWYGTRGAATWDELYVVFDGPLFDVCATAGLFTRTPPVARPAPSSLWPERLLRLLLGVAEGAAPGARRLPAMLTFLGLIAELLPAAGPAVDAAEGTAVALARARVLLASDLAHPVSGPAVAAAVGVPYERFRKAFRAHTGTSPLRYRTERRIAAAQELIRYQPATTNRELAGLLGFSDEYHFSRRFREHTGRTPREFRALVRAR